MFPVQDDKGNFWILTVLDHFTKFLWAAAFKTKEAPEIARWLLKTFRSGAGCMPERWHADNGGEFKNHHIDAVRELLAVNSERVDNMMLPYSHSMPRNPQCQGLVERGNRTLKTAISKQMTANGWKMDEHEVWNWVPYMDRQVMYRNRKVQTSTLSTSERERTLTQQQPTGGQTLWILPDRHDDWPTSRSP